jgi:hypothetical protein
MKMARARLVKRGIYDSDADAGVIRVFDGKAEVEVDDRRIGVGGSDQLDLRASGKLKARGFDRGKAKDEFYRWASLRSAYLAEANMNAARSYRVYGSAWYGPGWYWEPWYGAYTWIPGGLYYSPFGWGFYSPGAIYSAPLFGFGFGAYHHFGSAYRPVIPSHAVGGHAFGGFSGGVHGGGFAGHGGSAHRGFSHGFAGGHGGGGHR